MLEELYIFPFSESLLELLATGLLIKVLAEDLLYRELLCIGLFQEHLLIDAHQSLHFILRPHNPFDQPVYLSRLSH